MFHLLLSRNKRLRVNVSKNKNFNKGYKRVRKSGWFLHILFSFSHWFSWCYPLFSKVTYFYSELNSLQNKVISSQLPETLIGSKSRKTIIGQGHFFEFLFFGGKLLIVADGRSYIICRVFRGLSNTENLVRFGSEIRKLWVFSRGRICQNFKLS